MAQRKYLIHLMLLLAMVASFISALVLVRDYRQVSAHYGVETVDAEKPVVCPGQEITYRVRAISEKIPVILEIVESWCEAEKTGRCSIRLTTVQHLAVARPHDVTAISARIVPDDPFFQPGKAYELHHVTKNGREAAYVVEFAIGADCPPGGSESGGGTTGGK